MEIQEHLKQLAGESLDTFAEIADTAARMLDGARGGSPESLVKSNTFTDTRAVDNIYDISAATREGYQSLVHEPAISRVVAKDDAGKVRTYYISRTTSILLSSKKPLASYHSNIGKLASRRAGDEITISVDEKPITFFILERIIFHAARDDTGWDSRYNDFQHKTLGTYSIDSLRDLLEREEVAAGDDLEKLLSGEIETAGISGGLAHRLRTAMALRDQPILDEFQDEIFRLPIDSQLMILGPPGTGKTTTLIKRLGQKLDIENLEEADRKLAVNDAARLPHNESWLVFTPSKLLMHYVKEAFSREKIPAPANRIKTWESHRNYLARDVLGILKSNSTNGRYIPKAEMYVLKIAVNDDPRAWFDAFAVFHRKRVLGQLTQGIAIAASAGSAEGKGLIAEIEGILKKAKPDTLIAIYAGLAGIDSRIAGALAASKGQTDKKIREQLTLQFNRNKQFLHELSRHLEAFDQDEEEEDDQFDDDEMEEVTPQSQTDIQKAARIYSISIRNLSRYKFLKKSVPKNSRAARIRDWLSDRVPTDGVLAEIGQGITLQNGLRRFLNASRRYVAEVASSYAVFRRQSVKENIWYLGMPENVRHVGLMELDAIVLLILKNARELLIQGFVSRNLSEQRFYLLANIASKFKNQILVDEATDFSPLQLACMESLTHLKTHSFFACGDFNQRVTGHGIRRMEQVKWVSDRIKKHFITTVYRQSRKLNDFARKLLEVTNGDLSTLGNLPKDSVHDGVSPVLLENSSDISDTAQWLYERINEVEKTSRRMPTVAVLVNSEDQVVPVAEALNTLLEEISLKAVPCHGGQALGDDTDVRVFDVQHIKGLEFEAVFFVGIDSLAARMPDLFDKYLYVGTTRAATYLGITCDRILPASLKTLRDSFIGNW